MSGGSVVKTPEEKPTYEQSRIHHIVMLCIAGALLLFYLIEDIYWFNRDVKEYVLIQGAKSDLEKELQRREDLLANLLTISEEYNRHERMLFRYVAETREKLETAEITEGSESTGESTAKSELLTKLIARAEQYPDLKATKILLDLMDMLEITQDRIAAARERYVTLCEDFNICNQTFWCNFFTYFVSYIVPFPVFVELFEADKSYVPKIGLEDFMAGEFPKLPILSELKQTNW